MTDQQDKSEWVDEAIEYINSLSTEEFESLICCCTPTLVCHKCLTVQTKSELTSRWVKQLKDFALGCKNCKGRVFI